MIKIISRLLPLLWCFFSFVQCHSGPAKPTIQYELLSVGMVNDSLSAHQANYTEEFGHWKTVYTDCLHDSLFPDALYMGLQTRLWIGGISNRTTQNVSKQITVLDTSANGNILDILAINKSANCFSKINLTKSLQDSFYSELVRMLQSSGEYGYLAGLIDTSQITFKIGTLIDYSIRPDSLVSLLMRTQDSSLLEFRQILTTHGNALLIRAAMIFGFSSESGLKRKLTPAEEEKFKTGVYFQAGMHGETGKIKLFSSQNLQITISKNYTVFAQFTVFK
jgi:hypothetical protein